MNTIEAIRVIEESIPSPGAGLPEEIFLFLTRMTPMINVDLLIRDANNRILLSWRDDIYSGTGWHVPGGIIRFRETREECIRRTSIREIGTEVFFDSDILECRELIFANLPSRSHFITMVYDCRIPEGFAIQEGTPERQEAGNLAWHDAYPDNMITYHDFYRKYFKQYL